MKKHSVRLLALLLAVVMVLSVMPTMALAEGEAKTATLVTDVTTLKVGDEVVIAAKDADYALGTNQKTNNREAVAVTKDGSKLTLTEKVQTLTLQNGTKENTFAFYTGSGYLYAAGKSKAQGANKNQNHLKTGKTLTDNASWKIEIAEGAASVVAQGENGCNILRYNADGTLFSAYVSGQDDIAIYKLDAASAPSNKVATPTASPAAGEVEKGTEITFSCATQGAAIAYATDGKTFTEGTKATVTENVTFTVKATKEDMEDSDTATFAYTVKVEEPKTVPISTALAGGTGESFTVKGVVTLVDGRNYYLQDVTGGICLRLAATTQDIHLGDTIIGTGKRAEFSGLPQLDGGTFQMSTGMMLSAKETTIGALTTADVCTYVAINDVEVTEVYDNNGAFKQPNIKVKDADGKVIQLYKAVINKVEDAWEYKVGDKLDITAAVGINSGKLQLRNTKAEEIRRHSDVYDPITEDMILRVHGTSSRPANSRARRRT